ncbi:MAG: BatA and WFA domain-containing protein [Pirellulales bacterium]
MSDIFSNTLQLWQWGLLALVPPLIVLLYFLKLKRAPVEVPSTYLWSRAIEDLHVNSIWQRIRQNVLLFLQLLLVALVMLALLRPGCRGVTLTGNRFILLIDTSASMSAKDGGGTRLDAAKQRALNLIDQMKRGDVAMVISFSDEAKTEQSFTDNRRLLRERVQQILPTSRPSDLADALRTASGLANPGRMSEAGNPQDEQVAGAFPATLYVISDGGFAPVSNFSLGNLEPQFLPIGAAADNVGIVAFTTERNAEKLDQVQAFVRLENAGAAESTVDVSLYRGQVLLDAQQIKVPPRGTGGARFELRDPEPGVLRAELGQTDALRVDDVAYAAINPRRPANVLCVTAGNTAMRTALETPAAKLLGSVTFVEPTYLEGEDYRKQAGGGEFDLVIFDRCAPQQMPLANTLFIGRAPPQEGWSLGEKTGPIQIIDVERAHPLTAMPDPTHVKIAEGTPVKGPGGAVVLLDSQAGPMLSIAPRQGFDDAVLGFTLVETKPGGESFFNSDWPRWYSFPIFWQNVLSSLGGGGRAESAPSVKPGEGLAVRSLAAVNSVRVKTPQGDQQEIRRSGQSDFPYKATETPGVYSVYEGTSPEPSQWFAVNLFDSRETDLSPVETLAIGASEVKAAQGAQATRHEYWKWLLGCGLLVLVFEWYVYNRRVYL